MSQARQRYYFNLHEWRNISHVLTFRIDYFFRTIAILALTGEKPQNDNTAEKLRSMVAELEEHGIVGRERTKSWMHWYLETAWFVMSCFPKTKVYDAHAEWQWIVRLEGEFSDVAGALYDLLVEQQGAAGHVREEPSTDD
ncbi:hypothetical protein N0V86_009111 [Didymella sp. IMI 355093]|nr:hypothetical protein N0V86_009111 [Didymella sp. IMI 355093]